MGEDERQNFSQNIICLLPQKALIPHSNGRVFPPCDDAPNYHLLGVSGLFSPPTFLLCLMTPLPLALKHGALARFSLDPLCVSLYSRLLARKASLYLVSFSSSQTDTHQGNVK